MPDVTLSPVLAPAAKPGDLDRIFRKDTGINPHDIYIGPSSLALGDPRPGRDCPACTASRLEHTEWGCVRTGCQLSIALITGRPRLGGSR